MSQNLASRYGELSKDEREWLCIAINHARKFPTNHVLCAHLPEIWEGILPFVSWDAIQYVLKTIYCGESDPDEKWNRCYLAHKALLKRWKITPNKEVIREYGL